MTMAMRPQDARAQRHEVAGIRVGVCQRRVSVDGRLPCLALVFAPKA